MFIRISKIIKLCFILFIVIINTLYLESCTNKKVLDNEIINNNSSINNGKIMVEEKNNDKLSFVNDTSIEISLTSNNLNIYKSDKFVLLKEVIPNIREEMQYYIGTNFVGDRIDGYEENCAILTKEAAEALKKVNDELNKMNLGIVVYDAYRPMRAVKQFVEWTKDEKDLKMKEEYYPNVEKSVMLKSGYLSSKSGHARGSTIDISLYNLLTLQTLDMGGPFDFFGEKSHFNYKGLTEEQKNNRKLLRDVMTKYGFKGISTEWWHFRFIDEPYKDEYFDFPVSKKLDVV